MASKMIYELYSIEDIIIKYIDNEKIMNRFKSAIYILIDKCQYPLKTKKSFEEWIRIDTRYAWGAWLDCCSDTLSLYMAIEDDDVKSCCLIDRRRIDRVATKAGEERKGYASNMLMNLTTTLWANCRGYTGLSASVDKSVVPLFTKSGWIVMSTDKTLKKFLTGNGKSKDVAMCPATEVPFYKSIADVGEAGANSKIPEAIYSLVKRGWLLLRVSTIVNVMKKEG